MFAETCLSGTVIGVGCIIMLAVAAATSVGACCTVATGVLVPSERSIPVICSPITCCTHGFVGAVPNVYPMTDSSPTAQSSLMALPKYFLPVKSEARPKTTAIPSITSPIGPCATPGIRPAKKANPNVQLIQVPSAVLFDGAMIVPFYDLIWMLYYQVFSHNLACGEVNAPARNSSEVVWVCSCITTKSTKNAKDLELRALRDQALKSASAASSMSFCCGVPMLIRMQSASAGVV